DAAVLLHACCAVWTAAAPTYICAATVRAGPLQLSGTAGSALVCLGASRLLPRRRRYWSGVGWRLARHTRLRLVLLAAARLCLHQRRHHGGTGRQPDLYAAPAHLVPSRLAGVAAALRGARTAVPHGRRAGIAGLGGLSGPPLAHELWAGR